VPFGCMKERESGGVAVSGVISLKRSGLRHLLRNTDRAHIYFTLLLLRRK